MISTKKVMVASVVASVLAACTPTTKIDVDVQTPPVDGSAQVQTTTKDPNSVSMTVDDNAVQIEGGTLQNPAAGVKADAGITITDDQGNSVQLGGDGSARVLDLKDEDGNTGTVNIGPGGIDVSNGTKEVKISY